MEGELVVVVLMLHFVHVCVCVSTDFRCVYKLHKVQSQYSSHDMLVAGPSEYGT